MKNQLGSKAMHEHSDVMEKNKNDLVDRVAFVKLNKKSKTRKLVYTAKMVLVYFLLTVPQCESLQRMRPANNNRLSSKLTWSQDFLDTRLFLKYKPFNQKRKLNSSNSYHCQIQLSTKCNSRTPKSITKRMIQVPMV